ncbi:MAG: hypothetical protein ACYDH6_08625 [Acidimicrobiales bacterium]
MTTIQAPPDTSSTKPTIGAVRQAQPDPRSDDEKFAARRDAIHERIRSLPAEQRERMTTWLAAVDIPKQFGPEHENAVLKDLLALEAEVRDTELRQVRANRPSARRDDWIWRQAHRLARAAKKLDLARHSEAGVRYIVTEAEITLSIDRLFAQLDRSPDVERIRGGRLCLERDEDGQLRLLLELGTYHPVQDGGPITGADAQAIKRLHEAA